MAAANICMPFRPAFENSVAEPGAQAVLTLAGTTTLVDVFSNSAMTVAATNPIVANSVGRFPQRWVDDSVSLRMRVFAEDADITSATPLEDFDPYTPVEQGSAGADADNPNFTVATGAAGTSVVLTGTYPNLTLTIPRGAAGASGALSDGDMGDVVVSGSGTVMTVDSAAITLPKMANLAEDRIIGRQTAGAGVPEALTIGVAAAIDIPDRAAGDTRWIQRTESLLQSIYIPASAMTARTTNGAAVGSTETTTNKIMLATLDFDASTQEYAQFQIAMPKSWNEGTITFAPIWTAASGAGTVIWGLQAIALSNDDALDTAFGTAATSTDTLLAALDQHTGPTSAAITIGGSPAAEDLVVYQVYRNAGTLAVDAKLLGVRLYFTTNAADDS
jgi:hypothetical protein